MSLLSLLRIHKNRTHRFPIKKEKQNTGAVKTEPVITTIKSETNGKYDSGSSSVKSEPVFVPKKLEIPTEASNCFSRSIRKEESPILKKELPVNLSGLLLKRKRKKNRPGIPRKRELEKAVQIHKILVAKDPDSLTNKELDSLTWAEGVIVRDHFRRTRDAAANANPNDIQLCVSMVDEVIEDIRPMETNDSIAESMELAVVDFGNPGGRYSFEQGILIEKALGESVVNYTLKNLGCTAPTYGKSSWHDGVIILDCKDQLSCDFAKESVREFKLWRQSLLRALPPEKTPFMSKGRLYVPDLGIQSDEILDVLRSQNPMVNMRKWKVFEEDDVPTNGFKGLTLLLTEPPVSLLEHKQIKLFFGAGEVTLKLLEFIWPKVNLQQLMHTVEEVIVTTDEGSANLPTRQ